MVLLSLLKFGEEIKFLNSRPNNQSKIVMIFKYLILMTYYGIIKPPIHYQIQNKYNYQPYRKINHQPNQFKIIKIQKQTLQIQKLQSISLSKNRPKNNHTLFRLIQKVPNKAFIRYQVQYSAKSRISILLEKLQLIKKFHILVIYINLLLIFKMMIRHQLIVTLTNTKFAQHGTTQKILTFTNSQRLQISEEMPKIITHSTIKIHLHIFVGEKPTSIFQKTVT